MKQSRLIHRVYRACFDHDAEKLAELRRQEFHKIFRRRAEGKQVYTPKWTVVQL